MEKNALPTYFISHGGGPWPWLKEERPFFFVLEKFLREIPRRLPSEPKAILVVSGHWEEVEFTVMASPWPPMLYDYSGFPEHTYHIRYPAPGSTKVAQRVRELLSGQGFFVREDAGRGFDHGAFVPLFVMYPDAKIPVLQLSLKQGLDAETHIRAGRALRQLRKEGVLIVGSGLSFHNLRMMFHNVELGRNPSRQFDEWLQNVLLNLGPKDRATEILKWQSAPSARIAHPREEHLIPLMVALGAADDELATLCCYEQFLGAIATSSFKFG